MGKEKEQEEIEKDLEVYERDLVKEKWNINYAGGIEIFSIWYDKVSGNVYLMPKDLEYGEIAGELAIGENRIKTIVSMLEWFAEDTEASFNETLFQKVNARIPDGIDPESEEWKNLYKKFEEEILKTDESVLFCKYHHEIWSHIWDKFFKILKNEDPFEDDEIKQA